VTDAGNLLSLRQVTHRFRGLSVLRSVSLDAPARQVTGLIGPNGAGKSTLFNIVSGFLRPQGGEIQYDGSDITRWSITQRSRAGLIRTFQTPQVFASMTVRENLMSAGWLSTSSGMLQDLFGLPQSRRDLARMEALADEACSRFDLAAAWSTRAGDLPAGRQRLVELARAAVTSPRLLCLDEPSSGLNAEEVGALRGALELLRETGTTILLVSHDMELMAVASTVHVLCFGEIIASGTFGAVKEDPRVREAYLGV
jgi:branched-chain amino acid transport system ATP-binding protein/nonpolar-amino-acid-transporting ATPase